MNPTRLRLALPYFIGLVAAATLFYAASQIQYTPRGNELGPDFWPKVAIVLMAVSCVVGILRALGGASEAQGVIDLLNAEKEEKPVPQFHLLLGGVALLIAYAVVVPIAGFLLGSLLFLATFMYLGRYRNHVAIWSISIGATFVIAFLFLRFAYVSLPRGVPPFDRFTDLIRILVGG